MPDILHEIAVKASPKATYQALTAREGLAGWWTTDVQGSFAVGGVIKFTFGTRGYFDMKVRALEPGKRVLWEVVGGPDEWIGTEISFDLRQEGEFTVVRFKHQGWQQVSDFMHHCSTKWAVFLLSVKQLVETGKGRPFPDDVHISSWEE